MEFRIKGKVDGCPIWEITKKGNTYILWHWGIGSEFDSLRLPLELLDSEQRLRAFMHEHAGELNKVHAVLLLAELPLGPFRFPGEARRGTKPPPDEQ